MLLNGDRLTGTIVSAAAGKLTIKTEAAGDVGGPGQGQDVLHRRAYRLRTGETTLRSR